MAVLTVGLKPRITQINWMHPLTRGLVFDAPFAEGAGTETKDDAILSDVIELGILENTPPTWVKDLYGIALSFNGTSGQNDVHFTTLPTVNNLTRVSYETLYMIKGNGAGALGRLFVKSNGNGPGYVMVNIDGTNLNFNTQNAVGNGQWAITQPSSNVWHHTVFTLDDNNQPATIYLDGIQQSLSINTSSSGAHQGESSDLYIGNTQSLLRTWNGLIAYVRIWNRILSKFEVNQLYLNPWSIYAKPKLWAPMYASFPVVT